MNKLTFALHLPSGAATGKARAVGPHTSMSGKHLMAPHVEESFHDLLTAKLTEKSAEPKASLESLPVVKLQFSKPPHAVTQTHHAESISAGEPIEPAPEIAKVPAPETQLVQPEHEVANAPLFQNVGAEIVKPVHIQSQHASVNVEKKSARVGAKSQAASVESVEESDTPVKTQGRSFERAVNLIVAFARGPEVKVPPSPTSIPASLKAPLENEPADLVAVRPRETTANSRATVRELPPAELPEMRAQPVETVQSSREESPLAPSAVFTENRPSSSSSPVSAAVAHVAHIVPAAMLEDPGFRLAVLPRTAHIHFQTETAGDVALHLRMTGGIADVHLEGPATASFDTRGQELKSALASEGIQLGRYEVTTEARHTVTTHSVTHAFVQPPDAPVLVTPNPHANFSALSSTGAESRSFEGQHQQQQRGEVFEVARSTTTSPTGSRTDEPAAQRISAASIHITL